MSPLRGCVGFSSATQGSQSIALGLALAAASQLVKYQKEKFL
jgi:hypothetical protein